MGSGLLHLRLCQAACAVSVLTSLTATALTIAGFINMGTYHVTSAIGIWAGLLLYLPVFFGLTLMGTRHLAVGILYLIANAITLGFTIWSVIECNNIMEDFRVFRKYVSGDTPGYRCTEDLVQCRCIDGRNAIQVFKSYDYTVTKCSLFDFGENLFLGMLILSATGIFWSALGLAIGLVAAVVGFINKEKDDDIDYNPYAYSHRLNERNGTSGAPPKSGTKYR